MTAIIIYGGSSQDAINLSHQLSTHKLHHVLVFRSTPRSFANSTYRTCLTSDYSCSHLKYLTTYFKPSTVFNFVGQSSVGLSFSCEDLTFYANYTLALRLAETTLSYSQAHFYHPSSAYIFDCSSPVGPNSKLRPISPYASSKAKAYSFLKHTYASSARISFLHFFNHVSQYSSSQFIIPKIIRAFLSTPRSETILSLGDVNKRRDWSMSSDFMSILASSCTLNTPLAPELFLSSNLNLSVNDIVTSISHHLNQSYTINPTCSVSRPWDPDQVTICPDLLDSQPFLPRYTATNFIQSLCNDFSHQSTLDVPS